MPGVGHTWRSAAPTGASHPQGCAHPGVLCAPIFLAPLGAVGGRIRARLHCVCKRGHCLAPDSRGRIRRPDSNRRQSQWLDVRNGRPQGCARPGVWRVRTFLARLGAVGGRVPARLQYVCKRGRSLPPDPSASARSGSATGTLVARTKSSGAQPNVSGARGSPMAARTPPDARKPTLTLGRDCASPVSAAALSVAVQCRRRRGWGATPRSSIVVEESAGSRSPTPRRVRKR